MGIRVSLFAVLALILVAYVGVALLGLELLFGVIMPYAAMAAFLAGLVYHVIKWARSPVPFRIPTTCGQQRALPWIKASEVDNPSTAVSAAARVALEALLFRSLLRNTKAELADGSLAYRWEKWLWLGGLLFHWSLLVIVLRHLRFFTEPVPGFVNLLRDLDGFLHVNLQVLYITDIVILLAVTYLFLRRVVIPQVRYISLPGDYFPLFLILSIALSGILMAHFIRVDVVAVKELAMGLVTFSPTVPEGIGAIFYIHLFLVSVLLAYFPSSKLIHMVGIFLSPTRNLPNDSRRRRHVNPWNYPVDVHTYEEYEDEFREKMKKADIPVERY